MKLKDHGWENSLQIKSSTEMKTIQTLEIGVQNFHFLSFEAWQKMS